MKVLDTDTLTLLLRSQSQVVERWQQETDEIRISVVTRIEIFLGRFASLLKAEDGEALKRAQTRLDETERDLMPFAVLPISDDVAVEFDRLRAIKKLKKIGRADLLIGAIVLANRAVLVTRNIKDFRLIPSLRVENWAE